MNKGKLIEVSQTFKKQFDENRLGGIIITARKYREEGLNLHDIACALLFGEKEIRQEIIGFHLLNYLNGWRTEREIHYCLLKGIGCKKQMAKAYNYFQNVIKTDEGLKRILFDSPYSQPFTVESILQDKDWIWYKNYIVNKNKEKEKKLRKENLKFKIKSYPSLLLYLLIPIFLIRAWSFCFGNKISIIFIIIVYLICLKILINSLKINKGRKTIIQWLFGSQKEGDYYYTNGLWITGILMYIPCIGMYLPTFRAVIFILSPLIWFSLITALFTYSLWDSKDMNIEYDGPAPAAGLIIIPIIGFSIAIIMGMIMYWIASSNYVFLFK